MIQRDPKFYTTGYEGKDVYQSPFYLRALFFDGHDGVFNASLVTAFNEYLKENSLSSYRLKSPVIRENKKYPKKIAIINASHDNLPTSHETGRIFDSYFRNKDLKIEVKVINTREDLRAFAGNDLGGLLVVSQCVDKYVYDVSFAKELEDKGAVIVPGRVTAPGGVFSDKDSTYKMLSDNGENWSKVARYKKVEVDNVNTERVVLGIFKALDEMHLETGDNTFFVKPHEGGGGLGGFRITKHSGGYIIPDLSKVTGDSSDIHPTFVDIDVNDDTKLREILWIYDLFSADEKLSSNYLKVKLPVTPGKYDSNNLSILREYIINSGEKRKKKMEQMVLTKEQAINSLKKAIDKFEEKFNRRYTPLVNEHINFGMWGLRAHYRLSQRGPVLEAMYHRIFQLGFTEEGIGYLGSDNISNKQTGDLEIMRLGPLNEIMLEAIGGKESLFQTLEIGAEALVSLAQLVPDKEKRNIPLRVQLDLAAVSKRIGEGNADTARGLCLASKWSNFVEHAVEWLKDSLLYYSWKKE